MAVCTTENGLARDAERDNILSGLGLLVLRFDNRQVLTETDAVCEVIRQALVGRLEEN